MKRRFGIPKHVEMAVGMLRGGSEVARRGLAARGSCFVFAAIVAQWLDDHYPMSLPNR